MRFEICSLRPFLAALALGVALSVSVPVAAHADEVVVFAAASLKTGLDEFSAQWQKETGHKVTISYAGSGQLAKQIIEAAPADILISANEKWADEVEKSGMAVDGTRRKLLGNTLVLIAHGKDAKPVEISKGFDLKGLLGDEKLAMALVDSVPAGQYGKAALTSLGIWDAVSPSVAQADNVRAALALVAAGETPYGIVYSTDAAAQDNVSIVAEFPADSYPKVIYPALLLKGATDAADRTFFEALASDDADAAFRKQGFQILD